MERVLLTAVTKDKKVLLLFHTLGMGTDGASHGETNWSMEQLLLFYFSWVSKTIKTMNIDNMSLSLSDG